MAKKLQFVTSFLESYILSIKWSKSHSSVLATIIINTVYKQFIILSSKSKMIVGKVKVPPILSREVP